MEGYILILAIIVLGGVIATLGDRMGSRVGKARLSLFNLRPKKTAVLVTILTGSIISASTMGILLAANRQFRDGVFRIGEIQRQLWSVEAEREQALSEKQAIEDELATAKDDLRASTRQLKRINRSLAKAIARQQKSALQLRKLQTRYQQAQNNLRRAVQQVQTSKAQLQRLATEERQLRAEGQRLLQQRNQIQNRLKQEQVRLQQAEVQLREARQLFQKANAQRAELQQVVTALETSRNQLLQGIRLGNTTIRTGQILASAVVQNLTTKASALQTVNALLSQARQQAIALTQPPQLDPDQQVVQMTSSDVEQLVEQIGDGQPYLVRILSAANYLQGEQSVIVVPQVALNRVVFEPGTTVAAITVSPTDLSDEELLSRLDDLFRVTNRRAVSSGLLPDPLTGAVGSFQQINLFRFLLALKDKAAKGPLEILAVTPETISVAGPLLIELVAVQNQQVILRSR